MTLEKAYLSLNADADLDGGFETGVFELIGNFEINDRLEVDHLYGNEMGNINSVVTSLPGWLPTESTEGLNSSRVSYFLDLGAGRNIYELNALGWTKPDQPYQWGDPNEPNNELVNATGEPSMKQMAVLKRFLKHGEYDSRNEAAKLYYGPYYPDKANRPPWMEDDLPNTDFESYKHVTVLRQSVNRAASSPKSFDISITLQETEDVTGIADIVTQPLR